MRVLMKRYLYLIDFQNYQLMMSRVIRFVDSYK
jgi:hypothetical protein